MIYLFLTFSFVTALFYRAVEAQQGKVNDIYIENSEIVIGLSASNGCNPASGFYHIYRNQENWKELYSIVLAAFLGEKTITIMEKVCPPGSDRAIMKRARLSRD